MRRLDTPKVARLVIGELMRAKVALVEMSDDRLQVGDSFPARFLLAAAAYAMTFA